MKQALNDLISQMKKLKFNLQVAEPELSESGTKAYALKHYCDFVLSLPFSSSPVYLHINIENFQYSEVLKLRFSLLSEFVICKTSLCVRMSSIGFSFSLGHFS